MEGMMITYLANGNKIAEVYAFHRFKMYQRSLGTPEAAIEPIWDCCHSSVETRIRELPDNLEISVE